MNFRQQTQRVRCHTHSKTQNSTSYTMYITPLLQLVLVDSHIYYIVIAGHGRRVHRTECETVFEYTRFHTRVC